MKIGIIGGGICGLATAIALRKQGIDCLVFERAPQLNEVGAGIVLQPNAMQVLELLGIGEQVRSAGRPLDRMEITDAQLQSIRKNQQPLITDPLGNGFVAIHRARLQQALFEALPAGSVILGKAYQQHVATAEGVQVFFEDGSNVHFDLLLGSDGIHSVVRQQLFQGTALRYSGQTCWRGIAPVTMPDEVASVGREAWGRRLRFGIVPVSETEVYWFAVANAPAGGKDERNLLHQQLPAQFHQFHPQISEIIRQTPMEKMIRNDIYDLQRLPSWHQGRVLLLGDAAHATTPNMGQGACQGIEDAHYISRLLAHNSNAAVVFPEFERLRRKKVDYVVNNSWQFGQMAHKPLSQAILRMAIKWMPESMMQRQTQLLFEVN